MSKPSILIVDDDAISVEIASHALKELAEVRVATSGREALPRVLAERPDMVLLDVMMPDLDGIAVCEALKADERTRDIPVVFVTSSGKEADESRGLLAGAVEYVAKPIRPALLAARVRNLLELRRSRDSRALEGPLDSATGVASRRRLEEALAAEWRRAARRARPLSFVVIELGGLEAIAQLRGAGALEDALRAVGEALTSALARPEVLIARLSAERFALLLTDADEDGASRLAPRARAAVEQAALRLGVTLEVSIGAATARPAAASLPAELVAQAHQELDQALRLGGHQPPSLPRAAAPRAPSPGAGKLFVIDDDPICIDILTDLAQRAGYQIECARDAADVVTAIEAARPDVVLMDVEMPAIDGFEACRRLKASPQTAEIPVIFLSALTEAEEKVRAFEVGGADYVGKPFEPEEVLARVAHQIKIKRLQGEMRAANERLLELDRLKATFAAMLVHDLRSPLTVVQTTLSFLQGRSFADDPDLGEMVGFSGEAMNKSLALIAEVLEIYRSAETSMPPPLVLGDVVDVLRRCAVAARVEAKRRDVILETTFDGPLVARQDSQRLERAINNLLTNALKFTPRGGRVSLEARRVVTPGPPRVRIDVRDSGQGIPETELPHVFELYRQANTRQRTAGVGLGLAIVKRIIDAHQGSVKVRSQLGVGSVFTVELPQAEIV